MIAKRRRSSALRVLTLGLAAGWVAHRLLRPRASSLRGAVVLISGGSRGLGLATARKFVDAGCRVVICARDEAELARARDDLDAKGGQVVALPCDVTQRPQAEDVVAQVLRRFGRIDVLVNNAGIIQVGPLAALNLEDFEQAMAVNYWGALHLTWAVLGHMRARREGQIVNITSIGGEVSVPHLLPYGAAKAALISLSEGMTAELAKDGIAVTTIVPGLMRTGSPLNAEFKGDVTREFQWFSIGDSLRLTSMSAAHAADLIYDATARKDGVVVLGWQAKALRLTHALFPNLVMTLNALVNRLLPDVQQSHVHPSVPGRRVKPTRLTAGLTGNTKRAAQDLNEGAMDEDDLSQSAGSSEGK